MINYSLLIVSVLSLSGIFILNLTIGMYYGFGVRHYWFFQLLHFLGGFFVAMFFRSFTDSWTLILMGLGVITLAWESLEYLIAHKDNWARFTKKTFRLKSANYSWADGAFDLVCNFAGALLFLYLFK